MRILIEASEAYRNRTGIGRFSRALIAALGAHLTPIFSPDDYARREHDHRPRTMLSRLQHWSQHVWLTQGQASWAAAQTRPNLLHSLSFFAPLLTRVPETITVFDLAYFDLPHATDRYWGAYARRTMPLFARRAVAIFTTSEVMRRQISDRFAVPIAHVHVVYGGVDAHFHPIDDAQALDRVRTRYGLPNRYILYVGTWGAHKNLDTLLAAGAHLPDLPLVITGRPFSALETSLPDRARKWGVDARFIGYVDDNDLPALYHSALTVVLPSRYEGFGLPVIEAMACGTPIVIADIPVLREIAGTAAPAFSPDDPAALATLVRQIVTDPFVHAEWRTRGLARAAEYTWERSSEKMVTVWRSLM